MEELIKALFILLYKRGVINDAELEHVISTINDGSKVDECAAAIYQVAQGRG